LVYATQLTSQAGELAQPAAVAVGQSLICCFEGWQR
jgi:hypothetical protein